MARLDIDPDTGYAVGVAQRPDAPFPEASNVPADVPPQLDDPERKPDAFGSAKTAAPDGVEDAVIESGDGHEVPREPVAAAEALNDGKHGTENEYDNTSVSDYHAANSTNAETVQVNPELETVQTKPTTTRRRGRPAKKAADDDKK